MYSQWLLTKPEMELPVDCITIGDEHEYDIIPPVTRSEYGHDTILHISPSDIRWTWIRHYTACISIWYGHEYDIILPVSPSDMNMDTTLYPLYITSDADMNATLFSLYLHLTLDEHDHALITFARCCRLICLTLTLTSPRSFTDSRRDRHVDCVRLFGRKRTKLISARSFRK